MEERNRTKEREREKACRQNREQVALAVDCVLDRFRSADERWFDWTTTRFDLHRSMERYDVARLRCRSTGKPLAFFFGKKKKRVECNCRESCKRGELVRSIECTIVSERTKFEDGVFLTMTRRRRERERERDNTVSSYRTNYFRFFFLRYRTTPCVVRTFFVNIVTNGQRGRVKNDGLRIEGCSKWVLLRDARRSILIIINALFMTMRGERDFSFLSRTARV